MFFVWDHLRTLLCSHINKIRTGSPLAVTSFSGEDSCFADVTRMHDLSNIMMSGLYAIFICLTTTNEPDYLDAAGHLNIIRADSPSRAVRAVYDGGEIDRVVPFESACRKWEQEIQENCYDEGVIHTNWRNGDGSQENELDGGISLERNMI